MTIFSNKNRRKIYFMLLFISGITLAVYNNKEADLQFEEK